MEGNRIALSLLQNRITKQRRSRISRKLLDWHERGLYAYFQFSYKEILMSKCRPGVGGKMEALLSKGVTLEDHTVTSSGKEPQRTVVIRIPYQALLNDPEVQTVFQGIVGISTVNPAES